MHIGSLTSDLLGIFCPLIMSLLNLNGLLFYLLFYPKLLIHITLYYFNLMPSPIIIIPQILVAAMSII